LLQFPSTLENTVIQWRELLNDLNVEWRDKGKNCSRGNINISCPFCQDDPSFHLAISENKLAYFCYRNPDHAGNSTSRLFVALGLSYEDVPLTINKYNSGITTTEAPKRSALLSETAWAKFENAADSAGCVNYLRQRGFPTPVATCRQYDLRFARGGKWAQRVLLPINDSGKVISWTGRALLPDLDPKYRTESTDAGNYLYVPRSVRETLVIVEGPMDALKIAVATANQSISSLSILGKGYFNKLDKIALLGKNCGRILLALDADVPISTSYDIIYELSSRVDCPVGILEIPYGVKDAAELEIEDIRDWIGTT
jgi:hypothetical protein